MGEKKKPFYFHLADNGYIYDKRIFWLVLFLALILIGVNGYREGFKYNFYFECTGFEACENPLLEGEYINSVTGFNYEQDCTADWCTQELLPPGTYGKKPEPLLRFFLPIMVMAIILGLYLNHFLHNKNNKFGIKLNLPPKLWAAFKRTAKKFENFEDGVENEKKDDNNNGDN